MVVRRHAVITLTFPPNQTIPMETTPKPDASSQIAELVAILQSRDTITDKEGNQLLKLEKEIRRILPPETPPKKRMKIHTIYK